MLTAERLREVMRYEPDTGRLVWAIRPSARTFAGDEVGCIGKCGYRQSKFEGRMYMAHRLVWLYMTGAWPTGQVDHINGVRDDNRWSNLRDVTQSVNMQNQRRPMADGTTGFLGVTKHHSSESWRAQIGTNGRTVSIGFFKSPELAHEAYIAAKRKLHAGCTI